MCRLLDLSKISYVFQSNMCDMTSGTVFIADFKIKRVPPKRPSGMPRKQWERERDHRKLFVEIDGTSHVGRAVYDKKRTRWMESHRNAVVLRFSNDDVWTRPSYVLEEIEKYSPARKTVNVSSTSLSPRLIKSRRV